MGQLFSYADHQLRRMGWVYSVCSLFGSMINRIFIAIQACFVAVMVTALIYTSFECRADGGTVVRGLLWLECIR
jgi:hypothetical protein